jgi:hypothetical protein
MGIFDITCDRCGTTHDRKFSHQLILDVDEYTICVQCAHDISKSIVFAGSRIDNIVELLTDKPSPIILAETCADVARKQITGLITTKASIKEKADSSLGSFCTVPCKFCGGNGFIGDNDCEQCQGSGWEL